MKDKGSNSGQEIDTFAITVDFPPGIEEQEFNGSRGIATITLSADIICIAI